MYKIALLFEHNSRELTSLLRLQRILTETGSFDVFLFSIQFQVLELLNENKRQAFDAIVMPYVYKEGSLNAVGKLLKKNKNTIVFNLHHEQLSPPFDEPRMLPCDDISKNQIVHLVWNNRFRDKLVRTGVETDRIFITGNIRSDDLVKNDNHQIRQQFSTQYGLDINKRWILICESWGQVLSDQLMAARKLTGVSEEDMVKFNECTSKAMQQFSIQSFEIKQSVFDKFEIIYRNHPGAEDDIVLNPKIKRISDNSVYDWFQCVDVNIARNSTTLFEAEKAGIKSVRYDPTNMDLYFTQEGIDQYPAINHLNEIEDIDSLPISNAPVYIDYLGLCDGKCTERVADTISSCIGKDKYFFLPASFKYDRYRYMRKCASNIAAFCFFKIAPSLGERLMPSLRLYKNDIPLTWRKINK